MFIRVLRKVATLSFAVNKSISSVCSLFLLVAVFCSSVFISDNCLKQHDLLAVPSGTTLFLTAHSKRVIALSNQFYTLEATFFVELNFRHPSIHSFWIRCTFQYELKVEKGDIGSSFLLS